MMHKYNRLYIVDIMRFYDCSHTTAIERVKEIKNFFKLAHIKRISIFHLANYEGLTIEEVQQSLEK